MTILEAEAEFMDSVAQTRWYNDLLTEFISFLGLQKGARLLDVGSATGLFVRTVAGQVGVAVGVDASPAMVKRAQEHARGAGLKNVIFQEVDYLALPFPAEDFDIVVSSGEVPSLIPEPKKAIAEMARVTKRGGVVATIAPSFKCSTPLALRYAKEHSLPEDEASLFLQVAGIEQVHTHHHFTLEAMTLLCEECGLKESRLESKMDGILIFAKGRKS